MKNLFFLLAFLSLFRIFANEKDDIMSKVQSNIIEYIVCVVGAFARQFSLTNAKAYQYLRKYKGIDFLTKHYGAEHTLSIDDAVEDLTIICNRHGGVLTL